MSTNKEEDNKKDSQVSGVTTAFAIICVILCILSMIASLFSSNQSGLGFYPIFQFLGSLLSFLK